MIKFQFFPRSRGVTKEIEQIIDCFKMIDNDRTKDHLKSNEMLSLLKPYLEEIGFQVEQGKKESEKIGVPVLFGENNSVDKSFYADAFNHGKTICDTFQKRNVFFSVKNEM